MRSILPIATVCIAIVAAWYVGAVFLNAQWERDQAERAGVEISFSEIIPKTMSQERPVLPAPHQVAGEIWKTTVEKRITSKRSLVYHGWITMSATLLGFAMGVALGILLAVGIDPPHCYDLPCDHRIRAAQALDHTDHHREERQIGRDRRLRD